MQSFDLLAKKLAPYYSYFQVSHRLLFTGHSHQAWPDVAFDGQKEAFAVAAEHVDEKWKIVFQKIRKIRDYLRHYYEDEQGYYNFSANTHDLLVRWLSALDLQKKPEIITTDGEFHTISRQLQCLEELNITVHRLAHQPIGALAGQIAQHLSKKTACIICSHVFYHSSLVNSALKKIYTLAQSANVPLLIDDYHGTYTAPLSLSDMSKCYLLNGGYKYLQWGEGNCFLRFPKNCTLRPRITGWFSTTEELEAGHTNTIKYHEEDRRFYGATLATTPFFRAARVVRFFEEHHLHKSLLHKQYQEQIACMKEYFTALDLPSDYIQLAHTCPVSQIGGFIALRCAKAEAPRLSKELRKARVMTDTRNDILRFGTAPYIQEEQIYEAFTILRRDSISTLQEVKAIF